MDAEIVRTLVLFFPPWLFALCAHEFAHAWVATRLGDSTPERQGRLTLSPQSHIDPIGSLLLPAAGLAFGGFFFGWAKPVMVMPRNFSTKRFSTWTGHLLVALAGPFTNLLLAGLSAFALVFAATQGFDRQSFLFGTLRWSIMVNVFLTVFNLLPLPPLDGSRMLPDSMADVRDFLFRYSPMIFLVLIVPLFGGQSLLGIFVAPVVQALTTVLLTAAQAVLL